MGQYRELAGQRGQHAGLKSDPAGEARRQQAWRVGGAIADNGRRGRPRLSLTADQGISSVTCPGLTTLTTPAHRHWQVQVLSTAGMLPISKVGTPGTHGVTGHRDAGLRREHATGGGEVAAATCGLARLMHIANGMMLTIGLWSMMFAAGWLPDNTRLAGNTTRLDGAMPKLHISCAPLTTCSGIGARSAAGGLDLDAAVLGGIRIAAVEQVAFALPTARGGRHRCRCRSGSGAHGGAAVRQRLVVGRRTAGIGMADHGEAAPLELQRASAFASVAMVLVELPAISAGVSYSVDLHVDRGGLRLGAGGRRRGWTSTPRPGAGGAGLGPSVAGSALGLLMIESTEGGSCAGCASCAQAIPLPASIAMASNGRTSGRGRSWLSSSWRNRGDCAPRRGNHARPHAVDPCPAGLRRVGSEFDTPFGLDRAPGSWQRQRRWDIAGRWAAAYARRTQVGGFMDAMQPWLLASGAAVGAGVLGAAAARLDPPPHPGDARTAQRRSRRGHATRRGRRACAAARRVPARNRGAEGALEDAAQQRRQMAAEMVRLMQQSDGAVRAKDRLLAATGHDLRQPLQAMDLALEKLQRAAPTARRARARNCRRACAPSPRCSMACCCCRSSMPAPAGVQDPAALAGLFTELSALHSTAAGAAGVALHWHAGELACSAIRDARQPAGTIGRQRHQGPPRGGRVLVAARRRGDHVRIEVRDNGIGIAPVHQPRLFDEFFQVGGLNAMRATVSAWGSRSSRGWPPCWARGWSCARDCTAAVASGSTCRVPRRHAGRPRVAAGPRPARRDALAAMLASWGYAPEPAEDAARIGRARRHRRQPRRPAVHRGRRRRSGLGFAVARAAASRRPQATRIILCPAPARALLDNASRLPRAAMLLPAAPRNRWALLVTAQRPQHGARRRPSPAIWGGGPPQKSLQPLRRSASKQLTRLGRERTFDHSVDSASPVAARAWSVEGERSRRRPARPRCCDRTGRWLTVGCGRSGRRQPAAGGITCSAVVARRLAKT